MPAPNGNRDRGTDAIPPRDGSINPPPREPCEACGRGLQTHGDQCLPCACRSAYADVVSSETALGIVYDTVRSALNGEAAPADVIVTVQGAIRDMETIPMEPRMVLDARERLLREEMES